MNNYLIPANTKKGMLILGVFKPFDLALFSTGCIISILLLAFIPAADTLTIILVLAPGLITGFLVMPIPYYHNFLTVIGELYDFLSSRQKYYWKGWCVKDGIDESE